MEQDVSREAELALKAQELKDYSVQLGFEPTANMLQLEAQMKIAARTKDFDKLMGQHYIEGQMAITKMQIGLLLERCSVLIQADRHRDALDEICDILVLLNNEIAAHPNDEFIQLLAKIETIYASL